MRHATANALNAIYEWYEEDCPSFRACDWEQLYWEPLHVAATRFDLVEAQRLIEGESVKLPDCPSCAVLLDLAIKLRGGI